MESLDHKTIEQHSYIERYHLGTLPPAEEERFEAHFVDCHRCQEELEVQRSFTRGLKQVATEEAARSAVRLGLLAWLSRRGVAATLAAIVALAGGASLTYLLRENARLATHLAEIASRAKPTLDVAQVPVVLLSVVRSESDAPTVVTDRGGPWSLAVDAGADPRIVSYAVTLFDADDEVRFEGENLRPNVLEVIQLTFPTGFLPAGDYRLLARGTLAAGDVVELGEYPFRVIAAGG